MDVFKDKVAIVTGGASGIGRALGADLARRGASAVMADTQAGPLEQAVSALKNRGLQAEAATLDVTDFEAVKRLVEDTAARHGRLDYMFNNAGIAVGGEVRDCEIGDWRDVLDVNLMGVVNGVASAYPLMVEQGFGHIVNTASIEGLIPFPGAVSYVASKYGVVGLSNALRMEGADLGVKVSVVCPGYIKTPIFETSKMIKLDRQKVMEALPERLGITPEECARRVLRGVARNRAIIVVTGLAKILWAIHRISPALTFLIMKVHLRGSRETMRIEA
jgi:NAD(P)-dependent dehydrogenase (short-subunit alcohol dehydrogenase family)